MNDVSRRPLGTTTATRTARVPWVTCSLVATAVGLGLADLVASAPGSGSGCTARLEWVSAAVGSGEWWRVAGCHLVHCSPDHLLWNVAAMLGLGVVCERRGRAGFVAALGLAALAVPAAVATLRPELASYRGLSGLASACFTLLAGRVALERGPRRAAWRSSAAGGLLVAFLLKALVEAGTGRAVFVDSASAGFVPVPWAHLAGGAAGLVVALVEGTSRSVRRALAQLGGMAVLVGTATGCVSVVHGDGLTPRAARCGAGVSAVATPGAVGPASAAAGPARWGAATSGLATAAAATPGPVTWRVREEGAADHAPPPRWAPDAEVALAARHPNGRAATAPPPTGTHLDVAVAGDLRASELLLAELLWPPLILARPRTLDGRHVVTLVVHRGGRVACEHVRTVESTSLYAGLVVDTAEARDDARGAATASALRDMLAACRGAACRAGSPGGARSASPVPGARPAGAGPGPAWGRFAPGATPRAPRPRAATDDRAAADFWRP